ncbi:MAG TPA: hypothetical protein VNK82_07675 [Terriglobales bacterium]|nr:hypothetical protein [Terriglobales bacterium]
MIGRAALPTVAVFAAAMVLLSGTMATAAACQAWCARAAQPPAAMHHGGMDHQHDTMSADLARCAGMSAGECAAQMDARLQRRGTSLPEPRAVSAALAAAAIPQSTPAASAQRVAVAASPPDLEGSSTAIPLRI